MKEGWKTWIGKKVFIILKNQRNYTGEIIDIDDSLNPLVWITILDKFSNRIKFSSENIDLIEEEKGGGK